MAEEQNYGPQMIGGVSQPERQEGFTARTAATVEAIRFGTLVNIVRKLSDQSEKQGDFTRRVVEIQTNQTDIQNEMLQNLKKLVKAAEIGNEDFRKYLEAQRAQLKSKQISDLQAADESNDSYDAGPSEISKPDKGEAPSMGALATTLGLAVGGLYALFGGLSSGQVTGLVKMTGTTLEGLKNVLKEVKSVTTDSIKGIKNSIVNFGKSLNFPEGTKSGQTLTFGEKLNNSLKAMKDSVTKNVEKFTISVKGWFSGLNPENWKLGGGEKLGALEGEKIGLIKRMKDAFEPLKGWFGEKGGKLLTMLKGFGAIINKYVAPIAVGLSAYDGLENSEAFLEKELGKEGAKDADFWTREIVKAEGFASAFVGTYVGGFINLIKTAGTWVVGKLVPSKYLDAEGNIDPSKADGWFSEVFLSGLKSVEEFNAATALKEGMEKLFSFMNNLDKQMMNWINSTFDSLLKLFNDEQENLEAKRIVMNASNPFSLNDAQSKALQSMTKEGAFSNNPLAQMSDQDINDLVATDAYVRYTNMGRSELRVMLKSLKNQMKKGQAPVIIPTSDKLLKEEQINKALKESFEMHKNKGNNVVVDNSKTSGDTTVNSKVVNGTVAPPGLYSRYETAY